MTAIMLALFLLVWFARFYLQNGVVPFLHSTETWQITLVVILVVLAPIIVYFLVSRWGKIVEWSPYEDIDKAWKQGIDAMDHAGLSIKSVPFFLILGSTGGQLEQAIVKAMKAAGISFKIENVPAGDGVDHALRWFIAPDAIYLFCSDVGAISKLARAWSTVDVSAEIDAPVPAGFAARPATQRVAAEFTQTLVPGSMPKPDMTATSGGSGGHAATSERPEDDAVMRLPSDINIQQGSLRLEYLCDLIKRKRRPLCGVNGVVALLPYELVSAGGRDVQTLTDAIKLDLQTAGNTLRLRFPVTALVVDVQKAKGFGDFVGMLNPNQLAQRLGKRFETRQLPTEDRLQTLSVEICNAFEDWLYFLFRRQNALDRPDENVKLYGLLCRARQRVKPKLFQVLSRGFNLSEDDSESAFFSGCYLSATGDGHTHQQAFIKGIHDKLVREQSTVAWTKKALTIDAAFRLANWIGWAMLIVILVCVALAIISRMT